MLPGPVDNFIAGTELQCGVKSLVMKMYRHHAILAVPTAVKFLTVVTSYYDGRVFC